MERRSLIFVFVGTGLLFIFLLMQGFNASRSIDATQAVNEQATANPVDTEKNAASVKEAKAEQPAGESEVEGSGKSDESETLEADSPETDSPETDSSGSEESEAKASEDDAENTDANKPESEPAPDQQYLSIGSLAPGSPFQMLVTVNNAGAAVSRIELGSRNSDGRLRYRDVDDHSGYLGDLFPIADSGGLRIQVVGTGTPAALAKSDDGSEGLRAGDIIININDIAIDSDTALQEALSESEPGSTASIKVRRDGAVKTFSTVLTDRPLEVIRPEPGTRADGTVGIEEAFLMTLKRQGSLTEDWPALDPNMLRGTWEVADSNESSVVFERNLNSETIADAPFDGELTIRKTYRLAKVAEQTEEALAESADAYHLFLEIEVEKVSGDDDTVSLQINGPTGAPIEGWWYTNKIHGESTALFKPAGARDIVISTQADPHSFFGGPEIFDQAITTDEDEPKVITVFNSSSTVEQRTIKYAGVDAQYFTIAMIPEPEDDPFVVSNMYLSPVYAVSKDDKKLRKRVDVTFRMYSDPITLTEGNSFSRSFKIYAGPKEYETLSAYGLDDVRTFGWFAPFSKALLVVLHFFYYILRNYGIAIILLTVLVRLAMTPISRKAAINAQMMQVLSPEMKKLADRYKDDMEKRGQAQRELFKKYNYNPFSGCLLMFLQLPIFIGLYRALNVDIALRDQALIPGIKWCSNLAGPDQLWYWKDALPISWLTGETGWLGPYLNILPLITVVLFLIQQKLFTPPPTDEQQAMTQKMMTFMMLFIGLMFFKVPSGLCLYFITSSLWGIIERKLLPKPVLDKSKFSELGKDDPGSDGEGSKKAPKKPIGPASFMGIKNPLNNDNGTADSADDRRIRDKERQRKLREKRKS